MNEHPTLAAALVAAQAEMPAVAKDGTNPHFKSQFVTLDALIAATRPILNRHGLSIAQGVTGDHDEPRLTTTLQHTSGEAWGLTMPIYPAKRDMQALGSATTYGRRYAWAAILGIASEEDDDHQGASEAHAAKASGFVPPPPREQGGGKITDAQMRKIGAVVGELEKSTSAPPADSETWVAALKTMLQTTFGVESRKDLTRDQASALIDTLEAMAVQF